MFILSNNGINLLHVVKDRGTELRVSIKEVENYITEVQLSLAKITGNLNGVIRKREKESLFVHCSRTMLDVQEHPQ